MRIRIVHMMMLIVFVTSTRFSYAGSAEDLVARYVDGVSFGMSAKELIQLRGDRIKRLGLILDEKGQPEQADPDGIDHTLVEDMAGLSR